MESCCKTSSNGLRFCEGVQTGGMESQLNSDEGGKSIMKGVIELGNPSQSKRDGNLCCSNAFSSEKTGEGCKRETCKNCFSDQLNCCSRNRQNLECCNINIKCKPDNSKCCNINCCSKASRCMKPFCDKNSERSICCNTPEENGFDHCCKNDVFCVKNCCNGPKECCKNIKCKKASKCCNIKVDCCSKKDGNECCKEAQFQKNFCSGGSDCCFQRCQQFKRDLSQNACTKPCCNKNSEMFICCNIPEQNNFDQNCCKNEGFCGNCCSRNRQNLGCCKINIKCEQTGDTSKCCNIKVDCCSKDGNKSKCCQNQNEVCCGLDASRDCKKCCNTSKGECSYIDKKQCLCCTKSAWKQKECHCDNGKAIKCICIGETCFSNGMKKGCNCEIQCNAEVEPNCKKSCCSPNGKCGQKMRC